MNNRELVLSYLDSFATGDPKIVADHVSNDFENVQVGHLGTGCRGKDTYRQRLKDFLAEFTDLTYRVEELIIEGDNVAAPYTMTFTQNDRAISVQGVMIITIRGGHIAVRKDYWDGLDYQQQAGP